VTDVLVLCYHAVSPRWASGLAVTPARLEAQLRFLLERGYRGATFHEAVTTPPAAKTVAVTFDDGFRSVFEHGLGVLDRLGIPGTIFVVTDHVDSSEPMAWPGLDGWLGRTEDAAELAPVSWEELGRLGDHGWEIGSHTCTHPYLTRCDDVSLEHELRASRECCEERLSRPCKSVAYPYGDTDKRVADAAAAAGYLTACTLPDRLNEPERLLWPRVGVWHEDSDMRFRIKVSQRFRRLRGSPAWRTLGTARRLTPAHEDQRVRGDEP
jgi:peptidoglycan/xylan/chitin deacetylase (PgdA/CDA1 family)